jgi:hypothetical protein
LELLDWAVNKCRRLGAQKKGEEKPIKFRREYSRIFSELAPELNCSFLEDATSQSLFFNFKPNGFSQLGLKMRHKARPQHSTLDVEFPYKYNLEILVKYKQSLADYIGLPVEWVIVRMAGKSPAIGVMVPGVDVNEDWKGQEKKIVCIAKLANNFYGWIKNNVCM